MTFSHRLVHTEETGSNWRVLRDTVSPERAFQATQAIGRVLTADMIDFSGIAPSEVERVYVKFRDGAPMAAGIRSLLPHVDVRYIVSQEKQGQTVRRAPISFFDGYDGHASQMVWYADPINATGHTTIESLRFVRRYFKFETILISHVVANVVGIRNVQASLDDFANRGFMNYAHLSKKLDAETGYMLDGLELTPDFGDKIFGTLGSDYSVYDIQNQMKELIGTQAGDVELLKGTILHLVQIANREDYRSDRTAAWVTRNWITSVVKWYCAAEKLPFKSVDEEKMRILIDDLVRRRFLSTTLRPWRQMDLNVYSVTDDGVRYVSAVYIPILDEIGVLSKILKHADFLVHLRAEEIEENIIDLSSA